MLTSLLTKPKALDLYKDRMNSGSPRFVMMESPKDSSAGDPYAIARVIADHNKHASVHGQKLREQLDEKRFESSRAAKSARLQRHNAEDYMKMVGGRLKELTDSNKRFIKQLNGGGGNGAESAILTAGSKWGGSSGSNYMKLDDRRPQVVSTARCEVVNVSEYLRNSPRNLANNYAAPTATATHRQSTKGVFTKRPSLSGSTNLLPTSAVKGSGPFPPMLPPNRTGSVAFSPRKPSRGTSSLPEGLPQPLSTRRGRPPQPPVEEVPTLTISLEEHSRSASQQEVGRSGDGRADPSQLFTAVPHPVAEDSYGADSSPCSPASRRASIGEVSTTSVKDAWGEGPRELVADGPPSQPSVALPNIAASKAGVYASPNMLGGSSSHFVPGLVSLPHQEAASPAQTAQPASNSGTAATHILARREVQQAELDFLTLSYGSTHILLKHLREWGPEQSCHAGRHRIKFFTLVHATEALGVEELTFADFLVTATGMPYPQVKAAIIKYALQIGWARDLSLILANRVSTAYKMLTEDGTQPANFDAFVRFHKSIKDDKIILEENLLAIFNHADVDRDGVLSKAEYASLFRNNPTSSRTAALAAAM